jgi:carbonic anhydrase/acetyltransferase-like protein (isoleucine patch superfamily)
VHVGQAVCQVETSKALLELESPGDGILRHLYAQGEEVELGSRIALVAESEDELLAEDEAKPVRAAPVEPAGPANATRRAVELAEEHGIDLGSIEKDGFITAEDVERIVAERAAEEVTAAPGLFGGISLEGVSLPAVLELPDTEGQLDPEFLESLRADPDFFRALSSDERCDAYRGAGASIGEGVQLGERTLIVAPRIALEGGVEIGDGSFVECDEVFAVGALTSFGPRLDVQCRRVFIGSNGHFGRDVRVGGGGRRDPWATLAVGDLAFVGDEAFINPCRQVVMGREVFVTMRSMLVTHNIGHSVLEGFENRFAPIVLEDRAQVGLGTVVYAGCRLGREAIVASNSYVVSDIPAGQLAIGVPAKAVGVSARPVPRARQPQLARRLLDDFRELLELRGVEVEAGSDHSVAVHVDGTTSLVLFAEKVDARFEPPETDGEVVVLTLDAAGEPPAGCTVLDLVARRAYGEGGVVLDSVREFCRKRGIRLEPGPWRYRSGLI